MEILVNGRTTLVEEGCTLADLLARMPPGAAGVAVERNRRVVPRAELATTVLLPGDRLEVVSFAGGGAR